MHEQMLLFFAIDMRHNHSISISKPTLFVTMSFHDRWPTPTAPEYSIPEPNSRIQALPGNVRPLLTDGSLKNHICFVVFHMMSVVFKIV
jgi:hypothetical protein